MSSQYKAWTSQNSLKTGIEHETVTRFKFPFGHVHSRGRFCMATEDIPWSNGWQSSGPESVKHGETLNNNEEITGPMDLNLQTSGS